MKYILLIYLSFLIGLPAYSQSSEFSFSQIANYPDSTITSDNLEGKITVIKYWATWCGPCIPEILNLNEFALSFPAANFLAVALDDSVRLSQFMDNVDTVFCFPMISENIPSFEFNTVPFTVILDKSGGLIDKGFIKLSDELIETLLNDEYNAASDSHDIEEFSIYSKYENDDIKVFMSSYDSSLVPKSQVLINSKGEKYGTQLDNLPLLLAIRFIYNLPSVNRITFGPNIQDSDLEILREKLYVFRFTYTPPYNRMHTEMLAEIIEEVTGYETRNIIDSIEAMALVSIDSTLEQSDHEKAEVQLNGDYFKMSGSKIKELVSYLENRSSLPVVDKTGLEGNYDIELDWEYEDENSLNRELSKYGFKLIYSNSEYLDLIELDKRY